MKKYFQRLIRRIVLEALKESVIGIGLDHHIHSNSWAVLSLTDGKKDYVTFLELNDPDIISIQKFLSQFRTKQKNIDRNPYIDKRVFL